MKKSYKPKPNKDDLLGHYLAQSMPTVDFTKEEMKEKAVIGPYKDTIITVNQKLWMDNYNQIKKKEAQQAEEEKKAAALGTKPLKRKHDVAHLVAGADVPPPLPEASSPASLEKKEDVESLSENIVPLLLSWSA